MVNALFGQVEHVMSQSTMKYFEICDYDKIPYWTSKEPIPFTEDTERWFAQRKDSYEKMLNEDITIENPLRYIVGLMVEADVVFYEIYTDEKFFYESVEHLQDKRYITLWRVYETLVRDPRLRQISLDTLCERVYDRKLEEKGITKYKLKEMWELTPREDKMNEGRRSVRMYMALMGNRELRQQIFGF